MIAYATIHYDVNDEPIGVGIYATHDLAEHVGDLGVPDSVWYEVQEVSENPANVWDWEDVA